MVVLSYLPKLKRGPGLAFGVRFYMISPQRCSLLNTLSVDKIPVLFLLSFSRHQTKCVIKCLFKQLMIHKLQDFFQSSSKAIADTEKVGENR